LQFWEYLFNTFPFSDYNLVKRVRAAELTDVGEVKISGKPLSLEEKQQMAFDQMEKQAQPQGSQDKPGNPAFEDKFQKEDVFPTQKGEQWLVQERAESALVTFLEKLVENRLHYRLDTKARFCR
jgi:hypothetical protein